MQAKCKMGSARGALALLGRMRKAGVAPTAVTLNSVINAQAKQQDGTAKVALMILDAMKRSSVADVRPTVVTYTSAIDCQAKCSDGGGRTAVALLEEMCAEGQPIRSVIDIAPLFLKWRQHLDVRSVLLSAPSTYRC